MHRRDRDDTDWTQKKVNAVALEMCHNSVDNRGKTWYDFAIMVKLARMGRVCPFVPVREPRLVGWGAERGRKMAPELPG